ncbi:MAG: DNA recombination protein RmuC, partial [Treponema sp.]|nr:DNA recombination protein RmuC [Treponema sp.]
MEYIIIALLVLMVVALAILLARQNSGKLDLTPQLLDLKNQLNDLQTKQLTGQNETFNQQQALLRESQKAINDHLSSIMNVVSNNLNASQQNISTQLKGSTEVINEIHKKLGGLAETTKNIQEIGKDISSLQDILSVPKLRGNLGEYLLEDLLKQVFPAKNYQMKYSFK